MNGFVQVGATVTTSRPSIPLQPSGLAVTTGRPPESDVAAIIASNERAFAVTASYEFCRCPPKGPRRGRVEQEWVETGLGHLKTGLTSCSLRRVLGDGWTNRELYQRHGRDQWLFGKVAVLVQAIEQDHDEGVEETLTGSHHKLGRRRLNAAGSINGTARNRSLSRQDACRRTRPRGADVRWSAPCMGGSR